MRSAPILDNKNADPPSVFNRPLVCVRLVGRKNYRRPMFQLSTYRRGKPRLLEFVCRPQTRADGLGGSGVAKRGDN